MWLILTIVMYFVQPAKHRSLNVPKNSSDTYV